MLAEKIGKYELIERLASGSMGTVYSAHDPVHESTGRRSKLLTPQHAEQSPNARRFRKLFFNEAHAAGVLDHPNILRVFDADMDGRFLLSGDGTHRRCRNSGALLQPRQSADRLPDVVNIVYKDSQGPRLRASARCYPSRYQTEQYPAHAVIATSSSPISVSP